MADFHIRISPDLNRTSVGGKDALSVTSSDKIINKNSIIPIYYQLIQYIKQQISDNVWKTGDKIPSEREFCSQLQISRMTVRGAIENLKNEGLICSQKGLGNYVCIPKGQKLNKLSSFTDDMLNRGLKPGSKTLFMKIIPSPGNIARILHINKGEKVINLKRLKLADDVPMALENAYLNYSLTPRLLESYENGNSIDKTIKEKYGIQLTEATESIKVGFCNKRDAKLLKVKSGVPVFSVHRVSFTKRKRPVESVSSVYRGDRYSFSMKLEI